MPADNHQLPHKGCATCARRFAWRKRWARCWDQVRYCSDRCRRQRGAAPPRVEAAILELLAERNAGTSICPSEVARLL